MVLNVVWSGSRGVEAAAGHLGTTELLSHIWLEYAAIMRHNPIMILSRLREHRKRRGLTQIELALISGVGRATIAAIEGGKRTRVHAGTRAKLAKALKVKPHELERPERGDRHGTTRQTEAQDPGRAAARTAQRVRAGTSQERAGAATEAFA
jgi:transcriptional regulator with XRE-family HTH domain